MSEPWRDGTPGLVILPSGRRARGRSLRRPAPPGQKPTVSLHLAWRRPATPPWRQLWIRWPDFCAPADPATAGRILAEAYVLAASERLEVACGGGIGRTGTALAALTVIDGLSPDAAVAWVRAQYHPRAVETRWQRRFLHRAGL